MEENKIIDYIIIGEKYSTELIPKVLEKLKEGYTPLGGISVSLGTYSNWFAQAMIKFEK